MIQSTARIAFFLALIFQNTLIFSQNPDCPAPTFFKIFGQADRSEYATAITNSPDGHLYVAGRNNNRTFIKKVSLSGQVIWMRDFQLSPFEPISPAEIIVDSDGMIVGCGTQALFAGARRGFVFRYNPSTNTVLWARPISSNNPAAGGIVENNAGGHFAYYQNPILNNGESDIEILNLERATGAIIPAFARRYEFVSSDRLLKMINVNGSLFGIGWSEVDSNTTNLRRVLLARFNPINGEPLWARLGHLDFTQPADLYGRDLIADGDALISTYIGTTSDLGGNYRLFVQKTSLDGIIEWVRHYDLYSSANKLLNAPDGYIIYGNRLGNEHIVMKIDKAGAVMWTKKLDFGPAGALDEGNQPPNMGAIAADSLYFAGLSTSGVNDMALWKMLADGSMVDSCQYLDTLNIISTELINPGSIPVDLQHFLSTASQTNVNPTLSTNSLPEALVCPDCSDPDPCPEDNDFVVTFTGLGCVSGKIKLGFSYCEIDSGLVSDGLSLSIYNGNPFTEPADRLLTIVHDSLSFPLNQNCATELLGDLTALLGASNVEDGDKLYIVVNDPGSANTPYSLSDFPLSDLSECNYANNIDSFTIDLPTSPTLSLGPDRVICANQSATLDAGPGFYRYQWSNGATTQTTTISFGGNYRVTVTDDCGFRQFDTVSVQVNQLALIQESGSFCPGKSVTVRGFTFNQPGLFQRTLAGQNGACDTIATFNITLLPYQEKIVNVFFCPFTTVTINGQVYEDSGLVRDTVPSTDACDTIVLYFLNQLPLPFRTLNFDLCPGDSVVFNGNVYYQAATFTDTLYSAGFGCDTIAYVTIDLLQNVVLSDTIAFCPGTSVVLGGQAYTQPGLLNLSLPSATGCDTLATYLLQWLPAPTRSELVTFCPGESVTINGQSYNQPGTVLVTIPGTGGGCDTVITYTLSYVNLPPSNLSITCPSNINVATTAPGSGPVQVNFATATAVSDCTCDNLDISQTSGPASGALFQVGSTQVCFRAEDACGSEKTCCFNVTVREEAACDIKTSGCIVYELLEITANADQERTYHIRVTNNCSNKLTYTAIQLPSGVTAVAPANLSNYTSPDGRDYAVRNPNYNPFYSIRFKSNGAGISNGESEVFSYTLPAQSQPTFINIISRLEPQLFLSAHLNTFNCPIGAANRDAQTRNEPGATSLTVFPNPTDGILFADLSSWRNQDLVLRVLDARGAVLHQWSAEGGSDAQAIPLAEQLSAGLYFLEVRDQAGRREVARFVLD